MLSILFPLEMNICNKPSNKTAPEKSVWTAPSQDSGPSPELQGQRSRRNGWSWPPHPLQIVAWLLYLFFAVIGFGVLVPLLPHHWVPAGYAVSLEYMGLEKLGRWIGGRQQKPEAGRRVLGNMWGTAGLTWLILCQASTCNMTFPLVKASGQPQHFSEHLKHQRGSHRVLNFFRLVIPGLKEGHVR